MKVFLALLIGILSGTVIGIFTERQLYSTSVSCPEIPSCPLIPACPQFHIDQTSLNTCLKSVGSLVDKNNKITSEQADCSLSLTLCNSEALFWQQKYADFQCD
jgi:hypothetical protein